LTNDKEVKTFYDPSNKAVSNSSSGNASVPSHHVRHQPDEHNHHLPDNGKILGPFANNTLYFQTIRLTTSYQPSVHDLHVNLFGFSGQATRSSPSSAVHPFPYCSNVPDRFNETLLGRETFEGMCLHYLVSSSDGHGSQQQHQPQKEQ
jgi:hypothetical protein